MLLSNRATPTRSRRLGAVLLTAGLLGVMTPVASPPAAQATSTYLCEGYAGCRADGYSDGGYGAVNNRMYWRMYSGHNCTNYVAYRMIQAGMSSERPWSGSGMAYNWGLAMRSKTDTTPRVGAVAWWNRGVSGAGSSGHVAIVERVISPTEIVISEDSWGGNFDWRRITKTASGWPTGFIHLVDKEIANTAVPTITGKPQVGVPLTATRGTWKPGGTYGFQWLAAGVPIAGATKTTYTPTPAVEGKALTVTVTARKAGFSTGSATSRPTAAVAPGSLVNATAPAVTGVLEVGETLSATAGSWTPAAEQIRFRWRANGILIKNQYQPTLLLERRWAGKTISVDEVARRAGYEKTLVTSTEVGPVVEGAVEVTERFAASGSPRFGTRLAITPGQVSPTSASIAYAWLRDGVAIPGATAPSYDLTEADVGSRIVARMTATKQHFTPVVRTFAMGGVVTTPSNMTITTHGRKRAADVVVRVTAPGIGPATGDVLVTIGVHEVAGRLEDGVFRSRVPGLTPGSRRAVVSYAGTDVVDPARAGARLRVHR